MAILRVTPIIAIDENELEETFVRSSGPGGQNVNKVSSAVQLRFDPAGLGEVIRTRLLALAGSRSTTGGVLVLKSDRFRSRERNRADVRERLIALVRRATEVRKPRKPTRTPKRAKLKRLGTKKARGELKRSRRSPGLE
jgi:ribosome-associated protein